MLKEINAVRQIPGEFYRRWFFSSEQDLVVWYDADGNIVGFQLAYDKARQERSIYWKVGKGISHYDVDDGESSPFSNHTPLLSMDGVFDRNRVLREFRGLAGELPEGILVFVENRLLEYRAPSL